MPDLADVVRAHGSSYLEQFARAMPRAHRRALGRIASCRTAECGGHLARCTHCNHEHLLFHSCGNRACPRCGYARAQRWLEAQRKLLLPAPYFHVVMTLPQELRRFVRKHQCKLLSVLFRASYQALATLCRDPRYLGGQIGALAVLHTWSRTLEWHPHIHMLVPGGAVASDGQTWLLPPKRDVPFLVPVKALSKLFAGRFYALARKALPGVRLPQIPGNKRWVTFAKPTAHGPDKVLEYLGRYVSKSALSNHVIVGDISERITFRYRDSRTGDQRTMTLEPHEFLRRFLQHVPPKGLHRVRAYGLLHPAHRETLSKLQQTLSPAAPAAEAPAPVAASASSSESSPAEPTEPVLRCPVCKLGELRIVAKLSAEQLRQTGRHRNHDARAPPTKRRPVARDYPARAA